MPKSAHLHSFQQTSESKSGGDDQEKSTDNVGEPSTHLANAIRYLTQHGHDPTNIVFSDENESPVEQPEHLGFKNQERAEWTKHRTEIQNGVCFSFKKTGTCLKKGCNFIHFNPNAAYKDYSSEIAARKAMSYPRDSLSNVNKDEPFNRLFSRRVPGDNGRPASNPRRGKKSRGPNSNNNKSKLCFSFVNTGSCRYGKYCKFSHVRIRNTEITSSKSSQMTNNNFNSSVNGSFLEEMRGMVGLLREIVQAQQLSVPRSAISSMVPITHLVQIRHSCLLFLL